MDRDRGRCRDRDSGRDRYNDRGRDSCRGRDGYRYRDRDRDRANAGLGPILGLGTEQCDDESEGDIVDVEDVGECESEGWGWCLGWG